MWRRYTPPFLLGGAEVSQKLLATEMVNAGWHVLYVGSYEAPWSDLSQLTYIKRNLHQWGIHYTFDNVVNVLQYQWNGIKCFAASQKGIIALLEVLLRRFTCELVITSQEGSALLAQAGKRRAPVAGWIHSVSAVGMEVLDGDPQYALTTSRFVLSKMATSAHTKPLLFYPPFELPRLEKSTETWERQQRFLMINPVPQKGAELVRQLAERLQDRKFTLVEGWWNTSADFRDLDNVQYFPRMYDLNSLYRMHRLLLVPSVVEDAFPRVIIEAGLVGLPSIGSARGGISEAIADGGIVLPANDVDVWTSAIVSFDDDQVMATYAQRAHQHSLQFVRSCVTELIEAGVINAI